jgi:hypothetical protein
MPIDMLAVVLFLNLTQRFFGVLAMLLSSELFPINVILLGILPKELFDLVHLPLSSLLHT